MANLLAITSAIAASVQPQAAARQKVFMIENARGRVHGLGAASFA